MPIGYLLETPEGLISICWDGKVYDNVMVVRGRDLVPGGGGGRGVTRGGIGRESVCGRV